MVAHGSTVKERTGCGNMYVNLNEDGPLLFSARIGKSGTCVRSQVSAQMALIDLALKKGATAKEVIDVLRGIRCHLSNDAMGTSSCSDALAAALVDLTEK